MRSATRACAACVVVVGAGAAILASSGVTGGQESGAKSSLRVKATVQSATGRPIGARFSICAGDPLRCLIVGRTDAEGQIVAEIDPREVTSRIVLLAEARDWIGNTLTEVQWRRELGLGPSARIEYDSRMGSSGRDVVWDFSDLASRAVDEIMAIGVPASRVTCRQEGPGAVELDQVTVAADVASDATEIDLGAVRFPRYRAACEIAITVDAATVSHAWLDGYDVRRSRPNGDPMYPHFALAIRGSRLRLLMDRAAARLVRHDADALPLVRLEGRLFRIDVGPEEVARIGDDRAVLHAALRAQPDPGPLPGDAGLALRPAPLEPRLWWFMEQALR